MSAKQAVLEIKDLSKTFNPGTPDEQRAINRLSLTLYEGDFVTVIGSNGAGKSTLLNLITGVYFADEGSIALKKARIDHLPEYKRAAHIGRVFQDPSLGTARGMSLWENLVLARLRGQKLGLRWALQNDQQSYYQGLLKELDLDLDKRLEHKVGVLSGGQRQALTLIMAIMETPDLLLLDEHVAALDPTTSEKVLKLTKELVNREKLTTLMITHDMGDALKYGNRLIMLDAGRVVVDLNAEEKSQLKVNELLAIFKDASAQGMLSDRTLLS